MSRPLRRSRPPPPARGAPLPARLVVLASGSGSVLQALLDAPRSPGYGPDYPARVVAVGADRAGIGALTRAQAAGVPTFVVPVEDFPERTDWDTALSGAVAAYRPELVVCAGFMKILGRDFLDRFGPQVINTHPALLPAFRGAHPVRDALRYGVRVTGATVHCVDDGVDSGPVIAQVAVPVQPDDDESRLHERIKTVERQLLVDTVARLAGGFRLDGRKVVLP